MSGLSFKSSLNFPYFTCIVNIFSYFLCSIRFILLLLPSLYFSVICFFNVLILSNISIFLLSSVVVEYSSLNLLQIFCSSLLGFFIFVFCTIFMEVSIAVDHSLLLSWRSPNFNSLLTLLYLFYLFLLLSLTFVLQLVFQSQD